MPQYTSLAVVRREGRIQMDKQGMPWVLGIERWDNEVLGKEGIRQSYRVWSKC
jgi:hypothetical protein